MRILREGFYEPSQTLAASMGLKMVSDKLKRQAVIDLALAWSGPMRAKVATPPKQRIGIEDVLAWTYLRELPKTPRVNAPDGFRGAWDKVSEWAEELSLAGLADNRFGVVADFFAQDLPHNDALIVHEAVCSLDALEVGGLAEFSPFEERGDVAPELLDRCALRVRDRVVTLDAAGRPRLRKPLRNLVFNAAILGQPPEWRIDEFGQDVERWPNGMVKYFRKSGQWEKSLSGDVWVEFETAVSGVRPELDPSVAPKAVLSPDPTEDAVSRVYHELWRLALDVLAADLSGRLQKWDVQPSALPVRPWFEGEARRGRVLRDLMERPIPLVLREGEKMIAGKA
jgi:hypothetical protein